MVPQTIHLPFAEATLEAVAADLCRVLPGASEGDFSGGVVFLPSARACRTLGQAIFDVAGRRAILLPRILTPEQLADEAIVALGLGDAKLPADRVRPLILAHALVGQPWLAGRPESAPGLAEELISVFDEIRLHQLADFLLDPAAEDRVVALLSARPGEAESTLGELARLREGWQLYRSCVPRDHIDQRVDLAGMLESGQADAVWPFPGVELAAAAGFSRLDPVAAAPMRAVLGRAAAARVYVGAASDPVSRLLAATWDPLDANAGPTAPSLKAAALLGILTPANVAPAPASAAGPALRERLEALRRELPPPAAPGADVPVGRTPQMLVCADAEAESRVIADLVVRRLQESDGAAARIAVAVPDRRLAARVTAQLRAAGVDVDNTHGEPLSTQPAGLLLRFILKAAQTGLRGETLLEVLTHPYVELPSTGGGHALWTLRLEQMLRRHGGAPGNLAALQQMARDHDASARQLLPGDIEGMESFVATIGEAFAPLLRAFAGGPVSWAESLSALRETWAHLARQHPLTAGAARGDLSATARLLDGLACDAHRLPAVVPSDFVADLGRLLSGESSPPRRDPDLGILVTGHLEARLERFDLLVVGGLTEGALPRRPARPAFLAGRLRDLLGLPGRQESLSVDAELFLRLVHGGSRVVLTWSAEDGGQPILASSLVQRLLLVHGLEAKAPSLRATEPTAWRRDPAPSREIADRQEAFATETLPTPVLASARPRHQLSWSALKQWRECPYRFLLDRGFVLHREEEIQREFGRMDYGQIVHDVLQEFLVPGGAGQAALAAADRACAINELDRIAVEHFGAGADELPHRRLWLDAFRQAAIHLVEHERDRFTRWRPVGLESAFELPLNQLHAWVRTEMAVAGPAGGAAIPGDLPAHAAEVVLRGRIDRIDRSVNEPGKLAVIDYKTGKVPSGRSVTDCEELQVLLYAVAIEAGAVQPPDGSGRIVEGSYYEVSASACGSPQKPHLRDVDGDGRELLRMGAVELMRLATEASAPDGPFPLLPRAMREEGPKKLPCGYCDFRGACRLEERPLSASMERRVERMANRREDAY